MIMNEHTIEHNIQDQVLKQIRGGKIRIRSKAYFVFRIVLTVFVTVLALLVSAFVISFLLFSIHESGEQFLLGFGSNGILTFFILFPWISFLVDIGILLFLEWLLLSFKIGYRISFLGIFLSVFVCSTVLGIIITLTPLHRMLLGDADRGSLSIIGRVYEGIHDSHAGQGVFKGTITSMQGNMIVIAHDDNDHDADDGTRTIILPANAPVLHMGDKVYVFGSFSNGVITARGIAKLPSDQ